MLEQIYVEMGIIIFLCTSKFQSVLGAFAQTAW